jgi:glycosyltransferase involved in cell wall biosynthesis
VLEAMACGLPVVYPASGGTVELVGEVAGVGVPHLATWQREEPPDPAEMAEAVDRVLTSLSGYAAAARDRAVSEYALTAWLDRHAALFGELMPQSDGAPR